MLAACGNDTTPAVTVTPTLQPAQIADRAADAMLTVESLHFLIEREGALAYIDANQLLAFKRAEGDFGQPDRLRAVVRIITAFTPIDVAMIVLGEDQYATDPVTGEWGEMPPEWGRFNLAILFDPNTGIRGLLQDGITDLSLAGYQEIEGQQHYRLVGQARGERVSAMTGGFIGGGPAELEVWISTDDYQVHRLRIVEPETDPADPTTWNIDFSQLGQPVDIKAPPISGS